MTRAIVNRSGKMSVNERTDIDDERTDQVTHHEQGAGTTVERYKGGTDSWGKRVPYMAASGGV